MDPTLTDTIDMHGDPLAFLTRRGRETSPGSGRGVIKIEARQMAGHQKEAVAAEGADGHVWRLTSDEGLHLKGTDLAPFPLGFFNAGLQADLYGRIRALAGQRGIALDAVAIRAVNHYWLTGSFIHGTGEGHAEAPDIDVEVQSPASADAIEALVAAAMDASPAIALLRAPLTGNTFALYVNGRRRPVEGIANSRSPDAGDPYRVYARAPRPLDPNARRDLIEKTGRVEQGAPQPAAPTVTNKLVRNIFGNGRPAGGEGLFEVDTFLGVPGASHFRLVSDEGETGAAPSGLTLLSAGIAFCYMTQLSRYIENMKMNIHGVRLVQFNPYVSGPQAGVEPIDTHLFLNGEAPDETHLQLLAIAARTCYLHAASKTPVEPNLRIVHNGRAVARAA
ncbi:MAG: OsmC family protein [Xanthobacteraceae bacterium]|nr:OsmC family protein [Xanthobacteraceae bacterium]